MFDEALVLVATVLLMVTAATGAAAAADGGVALQDSHSADGDAEQTEDTGDATTMDTAGDGDEGGVPGFTIVVGAVAALALAVLVVRRVV